MIVEEGKPMSKLIIGGRSVCMGHSGIGERRGKAKRYIFIYISLPLPKNVDGKMSGPKNV
jgi:hypothetical protein|tara:strand:+ start:116 stop:295 length:180 start_codon:yes stop_codon:yes gene_type:complete